MKKEKWYCLNCDKTIIWDGVSGIAMRAVEPNQDDLQGFLVDKGWFIGGDCIGGICPNCQPPNRIYKFGW